jgi:hypothetical protein
MSDRFVAKSTTYITPDVTPVIATPVTRRESHPLHTVKTINVSKETV